jgi:hypothetical protein
LAYASAIRLSATTENQFVVLGQSQRRLEVDQVENFAFFVKPTAFEAKSKAQGGNFSHEISLSSSGVSSSGFPAGICLLAWQRQDRRYIVSARQVRRRATFRRYRVNIPS